MSVYEKLQNTIDECDLNGYLEILHSDYIFVRHLSGQEVSKEEWITTVSVMFDAIKEGKMTFEKNRCIYENSEILVLHQIGHFPDKTKEAILVVHSLLNGKIIKTESGATRID